MDATIATTYVRVSTEEQGDKNLSIPFQVEACRRFIEERGWAAGDVYADVALGKSDHRRELLELLFEKLVVGEGRIVRPVLPEPFRLLEARRGSVPEAFQRESAVAEEVVSGEA